MDEIIFQYIKQNNLELLKKILDSGIDVNIRSKYNNNTPLIYASLLGNLKIVEYLIKKGADIELVNNNMYTALNIASFCGHLDIVKILVQNKADIETMDDNGTTPVNNASLGTHFEVVEYLLYVGANPYAKDNDNDSLFTQAKNSNDYYLLHLIKYYNGDIIK